MEGIVHFSAETPVPMTSLDVVRSWKDPRYRRSLSARQRQALPEHPSGAAMLTDHELKVASGLSFEGRICGINYLETLYNDNIQPLACVWLPLMPKVSPGL
jgi:mersacidin/lichenicidin family type 2 lantibiotic